MLHRARTRRARLDRGADAALRRNQLESAREALQAQFTEQEQVKLTLMINIINGWNRIAVGFCQFVDPAEAKSAAAKAAA